jgi:hypothetical protein
MRVYLSTNGFSLIQYGTATYTSAAAAEAGVASEQYFPAPITVNTPFRGLLIVRGGATDFADPGDALFVAASKLGDLGTAQAGGNIVFQNAAQTSFTPTGGVAASNVQAAISELDTEKRGLSTPLFIAYKNAGQSLTNSYAKVTFEVESADVGGIYFNSRFQPVAPGYYRLEWSIQGDANPGSILSTIRVNNTSRGIGSYPGPTAAAFQVTVGSLIWPFNGTTDYAEVWAYSTSSACGTTPGNSTQFFGSFIGAL